MGEPVFFKDRVRKIFAVFKNPKIDSSQKEFICAGIQVVFGAGLASYTSGDETFGILPSICSVIAVAGTYNALKIMQKNSQKFFIRRPREWSSWDLASGIFTFSAGVYAFSEGLARNDRMWVICLPLAASGYHFTALTIDSLDTVLNRKPFLKCCQLMFEPALVASAATYLFYFRNHNQGWLKWLPFLAIGATGFKIVGRGCIRDGSIGGPKHLLLKVIETFMGGCFLSISCTVLAIYSSANDFLWPWTAFMSSVSLYGFFVIYGSLTCLRFYLHMDRRVFFSTVGTIVGPVTFSSAFLMVECFEKSDMMYPAFFFLTGTGQCILYASLYQIYNRVPRQIFYRYCQRVFGPVLAVYSSVVSAYTAYRMGWIHSLLPMPFVPAGIYATYKGFRKEERTLAP
ncbi:unnamed protein product [Larinioides sclopetarius]|uniref:Uncharacterized protein n=1 Tax=Larinioides sclopetarius TaxID=280406 RepID=A0AAV2B1L5_9ARAC